MSTIPLENPNLRYAAQLQLPPFSAWVPDTRSPSTRKAEVSNCSTAVRSSFFCLEVENIAFFCHMVRRILLGLSGLCLGLVAQTQEVDYSLHGGWYDHAVEIRLTSEGETIFYTTDRVNGETNIRLTTNGSAISSPGEWSPDGGEFVFVYHGPNPEPAVSGLYIIDLESGERHQLLDEFYSMAIRIWDPTQLPGFSGDSNEK